MAPITLSPAEHKARILNEIPKYQSIQDSKIVPLKPLQTFLTNVKTYLEADEEDEEFGEVDDSDLMLAESADSIPASSALKRKDSPDSPAESSSKKPKLEDDSTAVALAEGTLQKIWGFPHFRLKQEQAIARLIEGGSAVVVFPTGGGKSLVYQIPALVFDEYDVHHGQTPGRGVTLVVSPLIALMKVGYFRYLSRASVNTMCLSGTTIHKTQIRLTRCSRIKLMLSRSEESARPLWIQVKRARRGSIPATICEAEH